MTNHGDLLEPHDVQIHLLHQAPFLAHQVGSIWIWISPFLASIPTRSMFSGMLYFIVVKKGDLNSHGFALNCLHNHLIILLPFLTGKIESFLKQKTEKNITSGITILSASALKVLLGDLFKEINVEEEPGGHSTSKPLSRISCTVSTGFS